MEPILISVLKNFAGKYFTVGGDVSFINCRMVKDRCSCTLKYRKNAPSIVVYVD